MLDGHQPMISQTAGCQEQLHLTGHGTLCWAGNHLIHQNNLVMAQIKEAPAVRQYDKLANEP